MPTINAIIIPGLGGRYPLYERALWHWHKYKIATTLFYINWEDGEDYESKADALSQLIDHLSSSGTPLILIGVSAGASAALNAYVTHKQVNAVVTVCGFTNIEYLDQKQMNQRSPAFVQSVQILSSNLTKLTSEDEKNILSMTAYADRTVNDNASYLPGVTSRKILATGHIIGIASALLFYGRFIRKWFDELAKEDVSY